MKFDKLHPGMTLYEVSSYRMGNTTCRTLGTWTVTVIEVDMEKRRALVSWNGNRAEWHGERYFTKLKDKRPILVRTAMGGMRRPTREELKEIRAKAKEQA